MKMKDKLLEENGVWLGHVACPIHGGSDSLSLYEKQNEDGTMTVDGYCWSECGYVSNQHLKELEILDENNTVLVEFVTRSNGTKGVPEWHGEAIKKITQYESLGFAERKLPKLVNEFYSVKTKLGKDGTPSHRYYPSNRNGELVGYHVRDIAVKKAKNNGLKMDRPPFFALGEVNITTELFGQSLFSTGGKYNNTIVIASGEEDALAVFTALNTEFYRSQSGMRCKLKKFITPVVSTTTGESGIRQIKFNYDFINKFDKIVVMYDNDKAGKEGAEKVCKLFSVGKAYTSKYIRKDACEHSVAGEWDEIRQAFFNAESYSPAGVVGSGNTLSALIQRASYEKIALPAFAEELEDMLNGGLALGEITTIAGASSIGKTSVVTEFLYHWIMNSSYRVGIISLESEVGELIENIMSVHLGIKLPNMSDDEKLKLYNSPEFLEEYNKVMFTPAGDDRFYILDHQGAVDEDELMNKMEYLVHSLDCKITVLDPLQLAMSGKGNDDMDNFMSDLVKFVKKNSLCHINVCHVRKNAGNAKGNSEGGHITEESMKGSGSIFQVSSNNILIMRDKTNEDPIIRNTTKVVLSKARRTGNTGGAGFWYYDKNKGRLIVGGDTEINMDKELLEFVTSSTKKHEVQEQDLLDVEQNVNDWKVVA